MSFWQNVENELQYQNISRKELAARAGFAVSGISLGINNGNVPNAELAVKIADVLGVSVRYLVTGKPDKIPESSTTKSTHESKPEVWKTEDQSFIKEKINEI